MFLCRTTVRACPFVSHVVLLDVQQYSRVQQKSLSINDNFEKSSLAEFGCDARSVAGNRGGCCVGGRAVSRDRVAPGSSRC